MAVSHAIVKLVGVLGVVGLWKMLAAVCVLKESVWVIFVMVHGWFDDYVFMLVI